MLISIQDDTKKLYYLAFMNVFNTCCVFNLNQTRFQQEEVIKDVDNIKNFRCGSVIVWVAVNRDILHNSSY